MHLVKTEPFNFKSHFGSLILTLAKMFISLYLKSPQLENKGANCASVCCKCLEWFLAHFNSFGHYWH